MTTMLIMIMKATAPVAIDAALAAATAAAIAAKGYIAKMAVVTLL